MHLLSVRQNKEVLDLKRSGVVAILLAGSMLLMVLSVPVALANDKEISPAYLYTQKVTASLSIDANGQATCFGSIKASAQSDISMTITLYKKAGSTWTRVTSWNSSTSGNSLKLQKTYTVSSGTYKVVTSGSVTTSTGSEHVTETSSQRVYPAQ